MKKLFVSLFLLGTVVANGEKLFKHELGETKVKDKAERVIALEYSFVDALINLGIEPLGIADHGDINNLAPMIQEKLSSYQSVGSRYEPNLEVINKLNPDLIFADVKRSAKAKESLDKIAPTVFYTSSQDDYRGSLETFKKIALALGREEVAEKVLIEHEKTMANYKKKLPNDNRKFLIGVAWAKGFTSHSEVAYAGSIFKEMGLTNAITADTPYNKLSLEQVITAEPDVIIFMINDPNEELAINEWKSNPLWKTIPAVKNNQVFYVSRAVWSTSRGVLAAEGIMESLLNDVYNK